MESSVKKSYETNELPDGGTEYVIEGTRRGAIARGRLGAPLLTLIFSFGSFGGYVFLIFWVLVEMLGMNHNKLSFWFLSIPSLILTVFTLRKIRQLWMGPGKFSVKLALFRLSMDRVVELSRFHRGNGDESHSVQVAARRTRQPHAVAA